MVTATWNKRHFIPWKKSYDQPRQHVKKQRHYFANKVMLYCWSRLLRVPWAARRSDQSILKEISPEYSLEGLMLKLKLQYFGHLMRWLIWKDPYAGKDWRQEKKGSTEDEMVEWHHRVNGHEFKQALGVGNGQGGLACCGYGVGKSRRRLSDRTKLI